MWKINFCTVFVIIGSVNTCYFLLSELQWQWKTNPERIEMFRFIFIRKFICPSRCLPQSVRSCTCVCSTSCGEPSAWSMSSPRSGRVRSPPTAVSGTISSQSCRRCCTSVTWSRPVWPTSSSKSSITSTLRWINAFQGRPLIVFHIHYILFLWIQLAFMLLSKKIK